MHPSLSALDVKDMIVDRALPVDAPYVFDMEMDLLVAQARDLLTRAGATLTAAYANLAEAPDDVTDASAAVAAAKETEARISAMAKDKNCGHEARGAAKSLLTTANATLNCAAVEVDAHESGNSTATAKRTAHEASLQDAKAKKSAPGRVAAPRISAKPRRDDEDHDNQEIVVRAERRKRYLGEHDNNDERDNSVGQGKDRRPRKATSEAGRKVTRVLSGMLDEDTADEIVSTVGTGVQRGMEGAAAVFVSGDYKAIDRTGLVFGRGVKNTLKDTGIVSDETAQTIGHAATVTARTVGRGVASVRDGSAAAYIGGKVVDGAVAVKDTAVAGVGMAQDMAKSVYQYWAGEPEPKPKPKPAPVKVTLNGIGTGTLAAAAKALTARGVDLDTNDDGKNSIAEIKAGVAAWNKAHPKPTNGK